MGHLFHKSVFLLKVEVHHDWHFGLIHCELMELLLVMFRQAGKLSRIHWKWNISLQLCEDHGRMNALLDFHIVWKVPCEKWNLDNIFQYVQLRGKSVAFLLSEKLLQGFCSNQCFMSRSTWEIFYIYCQIFVTFIGQRVPTLDLWPFLWS